MSAPRTPRTSSPISTRRCGRRACDEGALHRRGGDARDHRACLGLVPPRTVRARPRALVLGLSYPHREQRPDGGAAAHPPLDHHRWARPSPFGRGQRRGRRAPLDRAGRQLRLCLGLPADDPDGQHAGQLSHARRGRIGVRRRDPQVCADRTGGDGVKRTHLPLNGLRVLDAAARHLSFTRAADELAVTPAAVGQQIRALEDTLGTVLFRRTTKGLELTPEGEAGLAARRAGLLPVEESVRAMQAGQSSKSLTIAAPRDLTAKWLMPQLAEIARTASDLRFMLAPADEAIDFTEANLDLAIRWGEGPGEHEGEELESDGMVTVERPGGGIDTKI